MSSKVSGKVVCLGCGLIVDEPGDWGCKCPPPSVAPRASSASSSASSSATSGPYRSLPPSAPCPRCEARLAQADLHDATVLDCANCGGLFVPRELVHALTRPDGRGLRLAFPHRDRMAEPMQVRYLRCPSCSELMNRQNFGKISGVLVDVCREHGIWFDAGEINAVIAFVEEGGMVKSEQVTREQRAIDSARMRERTQRDRVAAMEQPTFGRHRGVLGRRDDFLVNAFLSLFDR